MNLLHSLDDSLRTNSPYGQPLEDYNEFYSAAQGLMYDPVVNKVRFAYRVACGTSGGLNQSSDLSLGVYGVMVTYKVPASAT